MEHRPVNPRFNIYAFIHKALRAFMCDTLIMVGRSDANDTASVEEALAQVRELMDLCASHVEHENTFIHPAMESRDPGSSGSIAQEHEHHRSAIQHLRDLADAVTHSHASMRAAALTRLYRDLAVFIGQNMTHMEDEETANNGALWATHTDDELRAIEAAIHQVLSPMEMATYLRWMLTALSFEERFSLLAGIASAAPEVVFESVMGIARTTLSEDEFVKIREALAQPLAA